MHESSQEMSRFMKPRVAKNIMDLAQAIENWTADVLKLNNDSQDHHLSEAATKVVLVEELCAGLKEARDHLRLRQEREVQRHVCLCAELPQEDEQGDTDAERGPAILVVTDRDTEAEAVRTLCFASRGIVAGRAFATTELRALLSIALSSHLLAFSLRAIGSVRRPGRTRGPHGDVRIRFRAR